MPIETQDYVLAITGHDVEEWRGEKPPASASPDPAEPCLVSIGKLRVERGPQGSPVVSGLFAPWGVQISASFSKDSALRAFARVQTRLRKRHRGHDPVRSRLGLAKPRLATVLSRAPAGADRRRSEKTLRSHSGRRRRLRRAAELTAFL